MAKTTIYTSEEDEANIQRINQAILGGSKKEAHKWYPLRIALAVSLKLPSDLPPHQKGSQGGAEYKLSQVTGEGNSKDEDLTIPFVALLSEYHKRSLFSEGDNWVALLERHIQRGLAEVHAQLNAGANIHQYLLSFLFPKLAEHKQEAKQKQDAVLEALEQIGVEVELQEMIQGPRINRYLLKIPNSEHFSRLRKRVSHLSFHLGLNTRNVFLQETDLPKTVALDVPRHETTWDMVSFTSIQAGIKSRSDDSDPLWVCPGVDVQGDPYEFDLQKAPHLLVAGTTGSGKSTCLRALLGSLVFKATPEQVKICLIDPKGVELSQLAALPHLWGGRVITHGKDAELILLKLVEEMEQRIQLLTTAGVVNLLEYNRKEKKLPRIVVFLEEMADLLMQSNKAEKTLVRLAQKGRAMGIHLVLATQRPDAHTFSGLLRSNIPSRIALTVQKSVESKIILDEVGAEALTGKGDMLVRIIGQPLVRVHGAIVRTAELLKGAKR